jgi:hypothetical protein
MRSRHPLSVKKSDDRDVSAEGSVVKPGFLPALPDHRQFFHSRVRRYGTRGGARCRASVL